MKIVLEMDDLRMAVAHYARDILGVKFTEPVVTFPDDDQNPEWDGTAVIEDGCEGE